MLSVSSEVMFRKNLEGSRTQGLGPPSNSISLEEPRVTKATEEGSTAWGRKKESQHSSARHVQGRPHPATDLPLRRSDKPQPPLELRLLISQIRSVRVLWKERCAHSDILLGVGGKLICLFVKQSVKPLQICTVLEPGTLPESSLTTEQEGEKQVHAKETFITLLFIIANHRPII